jgi:acetate kinase
VTGPVLVLNSGSSSMKYQVVDVDSATALAKGLIERIGEPEGAGRHTTADGAEHTWSGPIPDHAAALDVADRLAARGGTPLTGSDIAAVGHRVVHGGAVFRRPVLIDDGVLRRIRELSTLAPLHNPPNAAGIQQALARFPELPQVAVFDTAFFQSLPDAAATYAIDRALAAKYSVCRYGFHGTSHEYVARRVAEVLGRDFDTLDQIVLHLGNGASASAIRRGVAVETSMGLTPLEGLVMGTRPGDLDPGILLHLHRVAGFDVDRLDRLLNRESGLLGLAGVNDFRDLLTRVDAGDGDAALALDVYCHRLRKYVGAYLAVLGGADTIAFTAGVGENTPVVRARALAGLESLGIAVDPERNEAGSGDARIISPDGAQVTVLVVPTNEELAIARATADVVRAAPEGPETHRRSPA